MTDPRREAIVAYALSQVGPGDVPFYWENCGIKYDADIAKRAWCGVFALTCLHKAGVATSIPWVAGLGFCAIPGRALSITKSPQPGDILYVDKPYQHHGVVESLVDGVLTSVEGNTPTVQRRVRPLPKSGIVFYSIDRFLNAPATPSVKPPPAPKPPPVTGPPVLGASLVRGIDVSSHQSPDAIRWAELAKTHGFVIARATYGTRPDTTFAEHVHRARDAGMVVGSYLFFRSSQDAQAQLEAFAEAVEPLGMGPGWIPPALDLESNVSNGDPLSAAKYAPAEAICEAWVQRWGRAMVYTNVSTWSSIGNPEWVREHLLWVANYGVASPHTPLGLPWNLWQHSVAPILGVMAGDLDQNFAAAALPLLVTSDAPALLPLDLDWDAVRRDRDDFIKEQDS